MQFRSTTDEMLAARFDPEPWVTGSPISNKGPRRARSGPGRRFDPRPEFIPSRDPLPYFCEEGDHRCDARIVKATSGQGYATHPDAHRWEFAPRPEFARPEPNLILVAVRGYADHSGDTFAEARAILNALDMKTLFQQVAPAQIEHARLVLGRLTRLANAYKED